MIEFEQARESTPVGSAPSMDTEKALTYFALGAAGLIVLIAVLDLALKVPFGRPSPTFDIMFLLGGGFVIWQGLETMRELK
jgi:hypothetical protein